MVGRRSCWLGWLGLVDGQWWQLGLEWLGKQQQLVLEWLELEHEQWSEWKLGLGSSKE